MKMILIEDLLVKIESRRLCSLLILFGGNKLSGTDLLIDEMDFSLRFMDRDGKDYIQVCFSANGFDWTMVCFPEWMKELLDAVAGYYGFIVEDCPHTIIIKGKEVEIPINGQQMLLLNRFNGCDISPKEERSLRYSILQRFVAYV